MIHQPQILSAANNGCLGVGVKKEYIYTHTHTLIYFLQIFFHIYIHTLIVLLCSECKVFSMFLVTLN